MRKPIFLGLLIASILSIALLLAVIRSALPEQGDRGDQSVRVAAENLTVNLDGQTFTLTNGVAGTVRVVGDPVAGDVDGDGSPDAALLLRHDPGGSGTFYYAVLAFNRAGYYRASNALWLGDRIAPQAVEFAGGSFVYRFLDRRPDQPMGNAPEVERAVSIVVEPGTDRISAGP